MKLINRTVLCVIMLTSSAFGQGSNSGGKGVTSVKDKSEFDYNNPHHIIGKELVLNTEFTTTKTILLEPGQSSSSSYIKILEPTNTLRTIELSAVFLRHSGVCSVTPPDHTNIFKIPNGTVLKVTAVNANREIILTDITLQAKNGLAIQLNCFEVFTLEQLDLVVSEIFVRSAPAPIIIGDK